MKFYLEKIFSCEYTGKSGLDYFAALDSEQKEAEKTQRLFPARLKSKVLKACQFRKYSPEHLWMAGASYRLPR